MNRLPFTILFVLLCVAPTMVHGDDRPTFVFGLNLNGPPVVIDGRQWDGADSKRYACRDKAFENQAVPLVPPTDPERAKMIRSSRWGGNRVELLDLAPSRYSVFLYVWEDNNPETFSISVNGRVVVPRHNSGAAGHWERLGPWLASPKDGKIVVSSQGGAANFSGVEVWRGEYDGESQAISADDLAFFEKRIRPLLADKCYGCHSAGAKEVGGELLVDSRPTIRRGGASGPAVVPGQVAKSLLFAAVSYADENLQMPPDGKLSDEQIADLRLWIERGAPDPRATATRHAGKQIDLAAAKQFWSLKPIGSPTVPMPRKSTRSATTIDRFILAKLEEHKLARAPDADKRTLIRRATYDLTGLPPTIDEVDAFLADASDQAFARVVDRLLDSPRYGERWARHWLDVVRYADTAGDNSDYPIPQMHRYRDWVVDAFNRDLPFDEFVRNQLAGDLRANDLPDLPGDEDDDRRFQRIIATGYIANARRFGSRVDDYPQHLTIEDTLDNLGRAFLGLSLSCSRCHDHKFDPLTTRDYYGLYGVFNSTRYPWPGIELEKRQRDFVPLVAPARRAEMDRAVADRDRRAKALDGEIKRLKDALKNAMKDAMDAARRQNVPAAGSDKTPTAQASETTNQRGASGATAVDSKRDAKPGESVAELEAALKSAERERKALADSPALFDTAYAVADSRTIEDAAIQLKGDPARTGDVVPRQFPAVLGGGPLVADSRESGRRELAEWLLSEQNPLTARVIVNRVWQHHFVRGLVPTPNDFGRQGQPPSHPELLDHLAAEFRADGWSFKRLHRRIMLSHTYRQSSVRSPESLEHDPINVWLSSYPRKRLDAESLRDTLLALGGNLDLSPAGPHPFPAQSTWDFTQHKPFKALYESNHRSVYLMTQRIQRQPFLATFDGADPSTSTAARVNTTTPIQSLYLLNDRFVHDQAERIASRLLSHIRESTQGQDSSVASGSDNTVDSDNSSNSIDSANSRRDDIGIARAYQQLFARPPAPDEAEAGRRFLADARRLLDADTPLAVWSAYIRALLRLNEFAYVE